MRVEKAIETQELRRIVRSGTVGPLATLALTLFKDGKLYASLEERSMIVGAIAFLVYCLVCVRVLAKTNAGAATVTMSALALWLGCVVGLWAVLVRLVSMRIEFEFSALRRTRWYEYAMRFFFGGAVTVEAGLIAKRYAPSSAAYF